MIYKVFGALDKTDVSQSVGDPVESPKEAVNLAHVLVNEGLHHIRIVNGDGDRFTIEEFEAAQRSVEIRSK